MRKWSLDSGALPLMRDEAIFSVAMDSEGGMELFKQP